MSDLSNPPPAPGETSIPPDLESLGGGSDSNQDSPMRGRGGGGGVVTAGSGGSNNMGFR